ncbi:MAG: helix-turn-helix domain-containing protein, partial [Clostridiales bacterium]|nr:helix-turn-helix domain-containing protein [Clostridiales bacterium]
HTNKNQFNNIKSILAEMVKSNTEKSENTEILNKSLAYKLLYELVTQFKVSKTTNNTIQKQKHLDRLTKIINYINENFMENISLGKIAEMEYLSVPYLSKFFEKNMGINFSTYLQNVRLQHAVNDLLDLDLSIEQIASKNGFSNPRSFVILFKKEYGKLPSQFRKQNTSVPQWKNSTSSQIVNYLDLEQSTHLSKLAEYLNRTALPTYERESGMSFVQVENVDFLKKSTKLNHTFKNFTSVGRARDILLQEIQEVLKTAQKEIGYKYIKFHHLLDDELMVYDENNYGEVVLNFEYIDKIFDFLLSIKLKPFVNFCFMPKKLAKNPNKTVFYNPVNTSEPKDMQKWNILITELTWHLIRRYGEEEVTSWLFGVWNEPDTPPSLFGFEEPFAYLDLYLNTYRSVKSVHPSLMFGTPTLTNQSIEKGIWPSKFNSFCRENNCEPDFINFHFYPHTKDLFLSLLDPQEQYSSTDTNPARLGQFIGIFKAYLKESRHEKKPVYLTEWNSTSCHRDLLNDTCFKSAYIAKNILENYDSLDSFGYWLLSDLHEEFRISRDVFHGGLGLFTNTGIKKPAYYAFFFLNKLGDTLISKGEGYFITKKHSSIRMMLYNYSHYSDLYASGEMFDMTFTDRYTPFGNPARKEFSINLINLPEGDYSVSEYIVSQKYGSPFDTWVEMGAQPLATQEEIELLRMRSAPMLNKSAMKVSGDHALQYLAELDPLEIRYVELRKV